MILIQAESLNENAINIKKNSNFKVLNRKILPNVDLLLNFANEATSFIQEGTISLFGDVCNRIIGVGSIRSIILG